MGNQYKEGLEQLAKERSLYPQEQLVRVQSGKKSISIGIPKESSGEENRVLLRPDAVGLLVANGHEVWVETKAGEASKFYDNEYSDVGAKISYSSDEVFGADLVLKVSPPSLEEIEKMRTGKALISAVQAGQQTSDYINALNLKKITALAFEYIEDKAGGLPIVRSMSEIAGSTVMLIAAQYLSSVTNGRGVILGGITGVPPTKVVILGSGTVAEHAARAALGLGAEIQIFDNHLYKLRRIKHALGQQVYTSTMDHTAISNALEQADVVIGAIRAEKGRNRIIVSDEMVANMKPESVIIDVSIDQGGCIETAKITSQSNPVYRVHDVIHYCVPNIASRVARTASNALSNIFSPILIELGELGGVEDMIFHHRWFMKGVYTYKGSLTNMHIARNLNMKFKDLNLLMAARF